MFGFYQWAGFRFPLLGVGIGILTGYGARLLFKGTSNPLGVVSAVVAAISVVATLFLMYGEFPLLSIISVIVTISVAYRIASS
jgi:sugar phosphate permease